MTARRITVLHLIRGDVFCAMADSEFAHSCCKVKPGLDSMYFKDQSADAPKNHYLIFLNHCSEGCGGTCPNLRNCGGLGSSLTTSDGITTARSISVILRLKIDREKTRVQRCNFRKCE